MDFDQSAVFYISMDSSREALQTNGKLFFLISNSFSNISQKPKNIQTNREAWILVKVQCVIYQWIRLDMLYKLIEAFSKFLNHFLN